MATDEEALAAEWESVADESAPTMEQSSEPVLNQAEIDSLLGTDDSEDEITDILNKFYSKKSFSPNF